MKQYLNIIALYNAFRAFINCDQKINYKPRYLMDDGINTIGFERCQRFENLNATAVVVKLLVLLVFGLAMLLAVNRIQKYYNII